ncbi:MAG: 2-dehydropantoate 2-reductase [Roseiflexaceae bacterium]|nr:2-dehydropantoate 2-reductase [Roseiflexaceae bacterium]
MRICIVGAGAIGGYLAAKLALADVDVTLIARGANLAAIRMNGLILRSADGEQVAHPQLTTDDMAVAGSHDVVIAAVKAHQLAGVAPAMRALYDANTIVVPAQNGIPWWYFSNHGGPYDGHQIRAVDPHGILAAQIETERVIGCVVYPAAELEAPGVIRHIEGERFTLGELDGTRTERIQQLARTLAQAGLKAPIRQRIRTDIWIKLWGNLAFNPISALTGATLAGICRFPPTRALAAAMMAEAQAIGERLDINFGISIEQRIAGAQQVGEHKTSMLQDIEAGRPTEIDALVGAVAELGRLTDIPTPHIDAIEAAVRLREQRVIAR